VATTPGAAIGSLRTAMAVRRSNGSTSATVPTRTARDQVAPASDERDTINASVVRAERKKACSNVPSGSTEIVADVQHLPARDRLRGGPGHARVGVCDIRIRSTWLQTT